ncbi:MAG: hypothetical protein JSS14_21805 [Proteobacteria bacterium]|nr:hypothetical protein [Pseudomonadota bacterium]
MTNSLIKNTTTETVVGYETIPGTPYVPATPPRTVYENRTVCGMRYNVPGNYTYVTDDNGNTVVLFVPTNPQPGLQLIGSYTCWKENVKVTYPGTPAVPATPGYTATTTNYVTGYNLGWNAGARSIDFITNDGYARFKVRASAVGVIAGLNVDDGTRVTYNGNTINFGFSLARGYARVVENGVVVATVGTYTDATVFEVNRTGTTITYKKDGTTVKTTTGAPTTAAWLEAAMYSAMDEVFDPSITQVSAADLTAGTGTMAVSMKPMEIFASSYAYGAINATMATVTSDMSAGLAEPAFAVMGATFAPLASAVYGLTGEIGSITASLAPLDMLAADHAYGEIVGAQLKPLETYAHAYEGMGNASMAGYGAIGSTMTAFKTLVVTMNSAGQISSGMAPEITLSAEMLSQAQLGSSWAISSVLEAVMNSLARSGSVLGIPTGAGSDTETWVLNVDSLGSTEYTNYNFNSYAFINGVYCGANNAGLFELDGDRDDGNAPIRAMIDFGLRDADNQQKKTWGQCYLGVSAKGNLFVKIVAEGKEYVYKTRSYSTDMQQQRVTFGKGLRTNYVQPILYNEDGADFELDTVTFEVADLSRKI